MRPGIKARVEQMERDDIARLKRQRQGALNQISALEGEITSIDEQLSVMLENTDEPLPEPTTVMTDHAILRYMERVRGTKVGQIRREIVQGRQSVIKKMHRGKLRTGSKMVLVVNNGMVVTVVQK